MRSKTRERLAAEATTHQARTAVATSRHGTQQAQQASKARVAFPGRNDARIAHAAAWYPWVRRTFSSGR